MDDVIINEGGFRYIESLECYGKGHIYNVTDDDEWNEIIESNGFGTKQWKKLLEKSESDRDRDPDSFDCYAFDTVDECCQDMVLTAMNVAKQGGALMIRAQQRNDQYEQRYY